MKFPTFEKYLHQIKKCMRDGKRKSRKVLWNSSLGICQKLTMQKWKRINQLDTQPKVFFSVKEKDCFLLRDDRFAFIRKKMWMKLLCEKGRNMEGTDPDKRIDLKKMIRWPNTKRKNHSRWKRILRMNDRWCSHYTKK